MRAVRIPCFVLLLVVVLALGAGNAVIHHCEGWQALLLQADTAAGEGRWDDAADALTALRQDWDEGQTWLHIMVIHAQVDEVDAMLQSADVLCRLHEEAHLRATLSDLSAALREMADGEKLHLENIL